MQNVDAIIIFLVLIACCVVIGVVIGVIVQYGLCWSDESRSSEILSDTPDDTLVELQTRYEDPIQTLKPVYTHTYVAPLFYQ